MKKIEIKIKDGNIEVEALGYKGGECTWDLERLLEKLDLQTLEVRDKPEKRIPQRREVRLRG